MQILSIAAAGMTNAQTRFDTGARRTAAAPLADLAGETVERLQAKTALDANAAVARTADDMTGTLLDILA
ncbi:flagellar hook protein FlgE [Brevundimonas sp.]|uniref:flagellar hook protein FlgE n=1 Tax=Brevundimonas sp. TaxID=1871086 RepID=UPI00289A457D|nr:flagellar hook protein FlgE [Brevundimonas sp.]